MCLTVFQEIANGHAYGVLVCVTWISPSTPAKNRLCRSCLFGRAQVGFVASNKYCGTLPESPRRRCLGELLCEYVSYLHFREQSSVLGTDDPRQLCGLRHAHEVYWPWCWTLEVQKAAGSVPQEGFRVMTITPMVIPARPKTMLENLRPSPRAIPGLWSSVDSSHSTKTSVISSDGETEGIDLENSYIGSDYSSEGDDDGYAFDTHSHVYGSVVTTP